MAPGTQAAHTNQPDQPSNGRQSYSQPSSRLTNVSRLSGHIPLKLPSLALIKTKGYPGLALNASSSTEHQTDAQLSSRSLDGHLKHLERLDRTKFKDNIGQTVETLEHNEQQEPSLRTVLAET